MTSGEEWSVDGRARRRTAKVLDVGRRIFASAHRRREYWVTLEGGEDLEVRDGGGEDALGGVGVARRQGVFGDVERAKRGTLGQRRQREGNVASKIISSECE